MKTPLVSVITPVFNAANYLQDALKSVQNQSYTNWEHILVDDCSEDNSPEIIKAFAKEDLRIKYHRLTENSGPGITRNKAIELSKGRFIAFLDCDDTWYPKKLEKQVEFMLKNNFPFTYTSYACMDESGRDLERKLFAPKQVTYKSALYKNPIGCLTAMYDTEFYGKQYMPEIRKRQDFALWLKLLKSSDAFGLTEILAKYRIQKKSVSSNKLGLIKYEWLIYRKEEGLGIVKSTFYVLSAILLKMKSYF